METTIEIQINNANEDTINSS